MLRGLELQYSFTPLFTGTSVSASPRRVATLLAIIVAICLVPALVRAVGNGTVKTSVIRLNRGFAEPPAKCSVPQATITPIDVPRLVQAPLAPRVFVTLANAVAIPDSAALPSPDPLRGPPPALFRS